MTHLEALEQQSYKSNLDKTAFGFWVYLMTDCILFATLFATYAILHKNTFGGSGGSELFDLPFVLTETMILLTSSFTCGLIILATHRRKRKQVLAWIAITFLLGLSFLAMELYEFRHFIHDGNSWQRSGFLTAFFTLVGTHGLHITTGLLWIVTLFVQIVRKGINNSTIKRLTLFSLFWHFLDIVWIFIFILVFMMGAL